VCVDVLLIQSDWEHCVTDFLGLWSSSSCTWATLSCVHADLCLPTTHFFLLQTLPIITNFHIRQLITDLAGVCHLLNFLRSCLCTITKLVVWKNVLTVNTHSSMPYVILPRACCLLGCKLVTFLHPVIPPCNFSCQSFHNDVHLNCCVLFWIICILTKFIIFYIQILICTSIQSLTYILLLIGSISLKAINLVFQHLSQWKFCSCIIQTEYCRSSSDLAKRTRLSM